MSQKNVLYAGYLGGFSAAALAAIVSYDWFVDLSDVLIAPLDTMIALFLTFAVSFVSFHIITFLIVMIMVLTIKEIQQESKT